MIFLCKTTVIMILTFYLASCNDDTEINRFTLKSSENNFPICGKYFIHDIDDLKIQGSLNTNEIEPVFIIFEIVNSTGGSIPLTCSINFIKKKFPSTNSGDCHCELDKKDTNLYHFTYKLLMKKSYSLSSFQATLKFSDDSSSVKQISVQEKIPEVIQIASTDHDFQLQINDDPIDNVTNCSKRVNSSIVKIGYSSMEGRKFVQNMTIIYNNKTSTIPNNKEEAIDLNMLDSKNSNVTLVFFNCANFSKQIHCMFILEVHRLSEDNVHSLIVLYAVVPVAVILLGSLGLFFFLRRKQKKRSDKKQHIEQSSNQTEKQEEQYTALLTRERKFENSTFKSSLSKSIDERNFRNSTDEITLQNSTDESKSQNSTEESGLLNLTVKNTLPNSNVERILNSTEKSKCLNSTDERTFGNSTDQSSLSNSIAESNLKNSTDEIIFQNLTDKTTLQNSKDRITLQNSAHKSTSTILTEESGLLSLNDKSTLPISNDERIFNSTEKSNFFNSTDERTFANLTDQSSLSNSIAERNLKSSTHEMSLQYSTNESTTPNLTEESGLLNSTDESSLLERKNSAIFVQWKKTNSRQFKRLNEHIADLYKLFGSEISCLIFFRLTDGSKEIFDLIGTDDCSNQIKLVHVTDNDINHLRNMLKETNSQSLQSLRSVNEEVYTDICETFGQNVFFIDMSTDDKEDFRKFSSLLSVYLKKDGHVCNPIVNIDNGKSLKQLYETGNNARRRFEQKKDLTVIAKPESSVNTLLTESPVPDSEKLISDISKLRYFNISITDNAESSTTEDIVLDHNEECIDSKGRYSDEVQLNGQLTNIISNPIVKKSISIDDSQPSNIKKEKLYKRISRSMFSPENDNLSINPSNGNIEKLNADVEKYEFTEKIPSPEKIESKDDQDELPPCTPDTSVGIIMTGTIIKFFIQMIAVSNSLLSSKKDEIKNYQQLLSLFVTIFDKIILKSSNPEKFKEKVVTEIRENLFLLSKDNKNRVQELLEDKKNNDINAMSSFFINLTEQKNDVKFLNDVFENIVSVFLKQIKNDNNRINMMREVSSEIDKTLKKTKSIDL